MGYDMHMRGEVPGEKEAVDAAAAKWEEAILARDIIDNESGCWMTDAELALPAEEQARLGDERWAKADELIKQGMDMFRARLLAGAVPPTEEYLKRWDAVQEASAERYAAEKSYHRLNIWGMGEARRLMDAAGMLKDTVPANLEWPEWPPKGMSEEVYYALEEGLDAEGAEGWTEVEAGDVKVTITDQDRAVYEQYEMDKNAFLAAHNPSVPGIEVRKLCSNDGWIVTPEECTSAAEIWDNLDADRKRTILNVAAGVAGGDASWFISWLDFIRLGIECDGFEVW